MAGAAIVVMAALMAPAVSAHEHSGYSVKVLVDGRPLTEYPARGTSYVEARRDAEYAVRLSNQTLKIPARAVNQRARCGRPARQDADGEKPVRQTSRSNLEHRDTERTIEFPGREENDTVLAPKAETRSSRCNIGETSAERN